MESKFFDIVYFITLLYVGSVGSNKYNKKYFVSLLLFFCTKLEKKYLNALRRHFTRIETENFQRLKKKAKQFQNPNLLTS
ncbi:hypothetical protein TNCT_435761 [Trichonephila clavata]|uniref:Uncharacterized protein n=1 Tax=Trichonephila clavata TaxID=2740835 RepID=A0A8X6LFP9_TRICU|nr:hypothetical protein TNCT_435761 [Trichonephila clavata]